MVGTAGAAGAVRGAAVVAEAGSGWAAAGGVRTWASGVPPTFAWWVANHRRSAVSTSQPILWARSHSTDRAAMLS